MFGAICVCGPAAGPTGRLTSFPRTRMPGDAASSSKTFSKASRGMP